MAGAKKGNRAKAGKGKKRVKRKPSKKGAKRNKPKTSKKTKKVKHMRKGPTISALEVDVGTICYGNDGQLWRVKLAGKSQRWVPAKMQARPGAKHKFRSGKCASKVHKLN